MILTTSNIVKSYEFFYKKIYALPKYRITLTEIQEHLLVKYIDMLSKHYSIQSLGSLFLWKYCTFQYLYWKDLELKSFNKKVNFSYFFGEKALKRFLSRNQEFDWQLIDIDQQFKLLIEGSNKEFISYRNPNRSIGLNTPTGLTNCIATTTLYDHKDLSCNMCIYKEECKELLRTNYLKIYKQRGYGSKRAIR